MISEDENNIRAPQYPMQNERADNKYRSVAQVPVQNGERRHISRIREITEHSNGGSNEKIRKEK